jgi:hypothetical protein
MFFVGVSNLKKYSKRAKKREKFEWCLRDDNETVAVYNFCIVISSSKNLHKIEIQKNLYFADNKTQRADETSSWSLWVVLLYCYIFFILFSFSQYIFLLSIFKSILNSLEQSKRIVASTTRLHFIFSFSFLLQFGIDLS